MGAGNKENYKQYLLPTALAAAFQIFYDGEYTTPHLYTRVLDREGNIYLDKVIKICRGAYRFFIRDKIKGKREVCLKR